MATENNEEECVLRYPTIQIIKDERVTGERVSYCTTSGGVLELGRKLLSAAREGDTELVRDLMAQGAPFTSDWLGTSPLHLAAMNGHSETCAVLVRAGISRDCRTKVDRTALHEAAAGGHAHAVRLLLDAGADPHARDMLRMTPLHWAVEREHAHVARELLLAGADPRAMSKFLLTPLDMSAHKCPNLHTLLQKAASRQQPASTETEPEPEPVATEEHTSEPEESPGPLLWEDPPDIHDDTTQQGVEVGEVEENGNGGGGSGEGEGAALLRAHGITLLPTDDGGTALSALRNGRTLVLSDAGKLLLKENGVRLLATPTATGQVKLEPSPVTPNRRRPKTVKILVNKNHLGRLIAAAQTSNTAPQRVASVGSVASGPNVASEVGGSSASHVVRVPEQFLRSTDPAYLRRQLLAAHASLASLRRQLARST